MKLALIGVGQAGGKIADALLEYDERTGSRVVQSAVAFNTAKTDLRGLDHIPSSNRVLIGRSRVKGHGVGADNELGAEIAREDGEEIVGALDVIPVHEVDAFLVVAALGGGTGSGAGPVIINRLQEIYAEPVYGLAVLPGGDEGGIYALNAARSLKTFVREADNLLLFDNDAWRQSGETVGGGFESINDEIARRFGVLFSAGEVDAGSEIAQSVVDSSEIINTLSGGGISTVGYATESLEGETEEGLLSRFSDDEPAFTENAGGVNRIASLVRKATLGRLTLPADVSSTERALVVVAGPPEVLTRKGIERARKWIEDETGCLEVRGGDYPLPGEDQIAAVVLLSGVTDVPRIESMQQVAVDAKDAIESQEAAHEAKMEEMTDDRLDSLF